jgi:hypothetical protein
MTFSAVFAIVVGAGMIGMWTFLYVSRQIPELETEPLRIGFHIAAEMATGIALIIGGLGLLTDRTWGEPVALVSLGMLLYTVIISPGYYAQKGVWSFVGMFAIIFVLALASVFLVA